MAGMMIAAERFDLIDAVHMTPISTSTTTRMRTGAGSSLNSSLLRLPLKRVEKEYMGAARRKAKSLKISLRGAREQEEALDLIQMSL